MDWNITFDEPFPQDVHTTLPEERTIVPVGTHSAVINRAEEGPNDYKRHENNPEGKCLKLRLAIGQHKFVFHDLPLHLPWLAHQLADALGIEPVGTKLTLDPREIEGREVTVKVTHYTSKAGKVSAVVDRYVPLGRPSSQKRSAPASKPAAPDKPTGGLDDIPFAWIVTLIASVIGGAA